MLPDSIFSMLKNIASNQQFVEILFTLLWNFEQAKYRKYDIQLERWLKVG